MVSRAAVSSTIIRARLPRRRRSGDQAHPPGQVPCLGRSGSGAKPSRSRRRCADARSMENGGRGALAAPSRGRARRRRPPRQGARCTPKHGRCVSFCLFTSARGSQVCGALRDAPQAPAALREGAMASGARGAPWSCSHRCCANPNVYTCTAATAASRTIATCIAMLKTMMTSVTSRTTAAPSVDPGKNL